MIRNRSPIVALSIVVLVIGSVSGRCYVDGSAGFTLPTSLDVNGRVTCPSGFVCPGLDPMNTSTYPVFCPPSPQCQALRLQGVLCEGSMGTNEPFVCPLGNYCPSESMIVPCPEGFYCPYGQSSPIPCPAVSVCPAGSVGPRTFLSAIILLILIAVVIFAVQVYRRKIQPSWLADTFDSDLARLTEPGSNRLSEEAASTTRSAVSAQVLARGFARSRGSNKPLTITFKDLSVKLRDKDERTLLSAVSGYLRPGKVTAILGPSGSGKTVLLKAILGRTDANWAVAGHLVVNGDPHIGKYRSMIGVVPQDDILHTELTVFRNMLYAAELRLPRTWTEGERADLMKAVLDELGLASVVDVPIGDAEARGISGGQRKRSSIAVELVAAPQALLLDEPTKGLDSNTALELVNTLRRVAVETDLTVAMVVNQPRGEIWNELDEILILGPHGRTVFQGRRADAIAYFTSRFNVQFSTEANPADVILDVVSARGITMADDWEAHKDQHDEQERTALARHDSDSADGSAILAEDIPWEGASFLRQVVLSFTRYLEKQFCSLNTLYIEGGVAFVLGLILGYSLSQFTVLGRFSYPFELLSAFPLTALPAQMHMYAFMSLGLATSTAGVNVFVNDKATFQRAAACGSNRLAHYIGTVLASWPRLFLVTLAFTCPYHALARNSASFSSFYFMFLLFSWVTYAIAGLIALVADQRSCPLIAGVASIAFSCFSGFIDFPLGLKRLSYCYWAAQALQQWLFADTQNVFRDNLSQFGWELDQIGLSFGVMVAMGCIYHVMGCLLLMAQSRP